jgi:cell division protein FtsW (lipid II flippase)
VIRSAWDLLTHVVSTSPIWFWPMLASLLLSVLVTQAAKPNLPERLSSKERHRLTQLVAFVIALAISMLLWPPELHWKHGIVVGSIVGLASPAIYPLLRNIIAHRWPHMRDWLSGDKPNP